MYRSLKIHISPQAVLSTAWKVGTRRPRNVLALIPTTCTSRHQSTAAAATAPELDRRSIEAELDRLRHRRNVGVFAHIDAGKTTVTERMLALVGVVHQAGSVDAGNTVTDFLPAERERGITIQSAAISFDWKWHNNSRIRTSDEETKKDAANDQVTISLIDTPGHVDFSVEVNRSVAVLDGAVLVVDSVAGVQAQTETVWRAMRNPSLNNHDPAQPQQQQLPRQDHAHEPLPCLAVVNKMDKEGCNFGSAVQSLRRKLPGANPVAIQIPLFQTTTTSAQKSSIFSINVTASSVADGSASTGAFVGLVDLVHMRAILWLGGAAVLEHPQVIPLCEPGTHRPLDASCRVTQTALAARQELLEHMAECDEEMAEYFLNEEEPSNADLRAALRRATLSHQILPVMTAAALKGMGVEPVLDAIADYLPSPLDRAPPALTRLHAADDDKNVPEAQSAQRKVTLGHPLHPSLLALAFKVIHMKGRGGSGDGRVVFARVYSGELRERDVIQVISPPSPGEAPGQPQIERVGGMLELAGGKFGNMSGGVCSSGEVCALIGLKNVVTGDTIRMAPERGSKSKKGKRQDDVVSLAAVTTPKPVLTMRLEAETTEQQTRLSHCLCLLAIEDPSLVVEETDSATLLSGLGELHIEVTLDRIFREFGLSVMVGAPSVTYRESITEAVETPGLLVYDRTIGGTRMQGAVHLRLEPSECHSETCMVIAEPMVTVSQKAREFLGLDTEASDEDLMVKSELFRSLVRGCEGALKRGPLGPYPMANLRCHIVDLDAEDGLSGLQALPGALRAAAAGAVSSVLSENRSSCTILEPTMSVEVIVPNDMVGNVLSDLTGRRGTVGDIVVGETTGMVESKALIRADVPLAEILGYANSLRSLTAGEGAFSAEYKGHSHTSSAGA